MESRLADTGPPRNPVDPELADKWSQDSRVEPAGGSFLTFGLVLVGPGICTLAGRAPGVFRECPHLYFEPVESEGFRGVVWPGRTSGRAGSRRL